ncbi:MAG: SRPBCC family protein [Acidimicrobiales bacterium]
MVAEQATERMVMRASPARCFATVTDFERYAEWATDIKSVEVEERDDQERVRRVTFRAAAFGRSTTYTLSYDYSEAPEELSWVQVAGDLTARLDGRYVFEPAGDGDTEVVYHLDVELQVPIPGFVKRRAEGRIIHTALGDLKARVEEGLALATSPGPDRDPDD